MDNPFASFRIALLLAAAPYPELLRPYDCDHAPLELHDADVEVREGLEIHDISCANSKEGPSTTRYPSYFSCRRALACLAAARPS